MPYPPSKPDPAERWRSLCQAIGRDGDAQWIILADCYGQPARAYHNLRHVSDCLAEMDCHVDSAQDRVALEFAIWFHDVIYDSKANDNEQRSAEMAGAFLHGTPFQENVEKLILATRHLSTPATGDEQWMIDIDLSILGRSEEVYDQYATAIRHEYSWVPEKDYAPARARVLRAFLDRPVIYSTPIFQKRYEQTARKNLHRELEILAEKSC